MPGCGLIDEDGVGVFTVVGVCRPSVVTNWFAYPFERVPVELVFAPPPLVRPCASSSLEPALDPLFVCSDNGVTSFAAMTAAAAAKGILLANSCAFCMGGGRKEDEGDGNGE